MDTKSPAKIGFETISDSMSSAVNYVQWHIDLFSPFIGKKILEIGVGHANYRNAFTDINFIGVDISPEVIDNAKKLHPNDSFFCFDACSDQFVREIMPLKPDTILCFHTLQYFKNDTRGLENMLDVIQEGGHLCLMLPAFSFLFGDMDKLAGHLRRYNKKKIRSFFKNKRVQIKKLDYINPIGGLGWLLNNFKNHKTLNDPSVATQLKIFDKYILPLSRFLTIFTKYFFWTVYRLCY